MFGFKRQQLYCAIDIEATGFDPLKEEILEIGFAFFKLGKNGFEITEEWSQVFKPSKIVPNKILGLTGISEEEIASAPALKDFHAYVQKKLAKAVLVGHSVGVDVKYLEANGFILSGQTIDTLELVQFILPTYQSYNLENLMHLFNISHKDAHRALADAKASIMLLEKLLGIYSGFPVDLKNKIINLTNKFSFPWIDFLTKDFIQVKSPVTTPDQISEVEDLNIEILPNTITTFDITQDYKSLILNSKQAKNGSYLLVLNNKFHVLNIWAQGKAQGVFSEKDTFNEFKFNELVNSEITSPELLRFILKILIWQATNWQNKTILDLNLSFAGNQFRHLINGGKSEISNENRPFVCDQQTFLSLNNNSTLASKHVIIEGLNEFEEQISSRIGKRASWGYVTKILTSIYNPETNFGNIEFRDEVINLLSATDLFYGVVLACVQNYKPTQPQITIEQLQLNASNYNKISSAAKNYLVKLENFESVNKNQALKDFILALHSFFEEEDNRVKWIDFNLNYCSFNNLPLELNKITQKTLQAFSKVSFVDNLNDKLVNFFTVRLGLESFGQRQAAFSFPTPQVETQPLQINDDQFVRNLVLPSVMVFNSYKEIKNFYDKNYKELQQKATLIAEGYSGGTGKMLNNFVAAKNGLLLLSSKIASRSGRFGMKTQGLMFTSLPKDPNSDIYASAVLAHIGQTLPEAPTLRSLIEIHYVLRSFYTPELKSVYLDPMYFDPKNGSFLDFIKGYSFILVK